MTTGRKGVLMKYLERRSRLTVGALVGLALATAAIGAYAVASADSGAQPSPIESLRAGPGGPGVFAHASDLNPAVAAPVFALRDGREVSVVANASAKCLISKAGARIAGETCDTVAAIDEGKAISVSDECSVSGHQLMEVNGLAPEGVTSVRLVSSDGSYQVTTVVDGAFEFDGTNPAEGAPYPTGIAWIASDGASAGTAQWPVEGDQFCIPT
jgi:hypothetical protein